MLSVPENAAFPLNVTVIDMEILHEFDLQFSHKIAFRQCD